MQCRALKILSQQLEQKQRWRRYVYLFTTCRKRLTSYFITLSAILESTNSITPRRRLSTIWKTLEYLCTIYVHSKNYQGKTRKPPCGYKGQTKSKRFFQLNISSKKQTNKFYFTTMKPEVDLFSFVFWRKLKTPKRHFEIIWPVRE